MLVELINMLCLVFIFITRDLSMVVHACDLSTRDGNEFSGLNPD